MFKKHNKIIITIIILTLLISSFTYAVGTKKTIEVMFNAVKLTVNGQKVDADTIVYNGTTYVPLRAAAELLGKEVGWDQATQTASINDKVAEKLAINDKESEKPPVKDTETLTQKNAIKKAQSYLSYSAFSKSGLIKQLEFEGFSKEDSTYAVNSLNIDWKEQAYKKAESYIEYSSFSRSGLIKQLEFEGFSNEEAAYGVDKIGL